VVAAYTVLHGNAPPTTATKDLIPVLVEVAESRPDLVVASEEVRKYYPVCHFDCHIHRLNAYMQQGARWTKGNGPYADGPQLRVVH
jgi:hypothetical protein